MDDEHDGKILVTESQLGRLYVYWEAWGGLNFLHIRYWILDRRNNQWIPGKKGIAIPENKAHGTVEAFLKLAEQNA